MFIFVDDVVESSTPYCGAPIFVSFFPCTENSSAFTGHSSHGAAMQSNTLGSRIFFSGHKIVQGIFCYPYRIHGIGIFTYIWLNCMISLNVGKYTIHRSYWVSVWHRVSWVCVFQCPFFIAQGDPEPKRSTLHIPRIVIQFVSCKYRQASNPQTLFIRRERPCFAFENSHGGVSLWLPRVLLCCKRRFSMTSWGPNNHESGMPTKICKQQQKKV